MDRGIENQPALQVTIQEMSSRSGDNHVNQDLGVRKPWSATAFDHNKYSYENNCLPGAMCMEGGVASRLAAGPDTLVHPSEILKSGVCPSAH